MGGPALLDAQADRVLSRHNDMMSWLNRHAIGGIVSDGGTTQGSGASGALNFDIDTTLVVESLIDGEVGTLAAQTDADSDAGDGVDFGATSGKSVVFAVVLSHGSGNDTPAVVAVAGAVADTGEEVEPTDAEIDTALGHAFWAPLALVTIDRTGDTAVTFTADNSWRYRTVEGHTEPLSETEDEFKTEAGVP